MTKHIIAQCKIFEDIELGPDNIYELERSLFYE